MCVFIVAGSHADFGMTVWRGIEQAGEIDEQEFDVPSFCPEKPDPDEPGSNGGRFHRNMGGIARMRSLLPNAHYGAIVSAIGFLPIVQVSTIYHSTPSTRIILSTLVGPRFWNVHERRFGTCDYLDKGMAA